MYRISLRRLISPVVLLLAATVLRQEVTTLSTAYQQLMSYLPYVLLAVVLALCLYYHRSRLFTATLSLLVIYYLIQTRLQTALSRQDALLIYSLISVLHPSSLLVLLFLPERGLLNRYGLTLTALFVFMLIVAAALMVYFPEPLVSMITLWWPVKPVTGLILSWSASFLYMLVVLVGLHHLIKRNDDFAAMIITIALFGFVTLAKLNLAGISTVMFCAMSAALIIAMMGSSYDMAYRDELSGLLGRRALNDRLRGLARQYVIAMMDVDHFKKFNDTHGHDIGDEVLKMVARKIGAVQGGGTAYRYGGEEFCVVFAGRDMDYCRPLLEDVRRDVQNHQMRIRDDSHRPKSKQAVKQRRGRRVKSRNGTSVSVTVSIGMAEPGSKHDNPEAVLKAADTALYKAKKKGRNCLSD